MDSIYDLLKFKANDIDSSGVKNDLEIIQAELERYFEKEISVRKFKDGVAVIESRSAPCASEMRMKQHQLLEDLNSILKNKISRFVIRIV